MPMALAALLVAFIVTVFDMQHSLLPETCAECPHCQARVVEKAAKQRELDRAYARTHGLDLDEKDDRSIG